MNGTAPKLKMVMATLQVGPRTEIFIEKTWKQNKKLIDYHLNICLIWEILVYLAVMIVVLEFHFPRLKKI